MLTCVDFHHRTVCESRPVNGLSRTECPLEDVREKKKDPKKKNHGPKRKENSYWRSQKHQMELACRALEEVGSCLSEPVRGGLTEVSERRPVDTKPPITFGGGMHDISVAQAQRRKEAANTIRTQFRQHRIQVQTRNEFKVRMSVRTLQRAYRGHLVRRADRLVVAVRFRELFLRHKKFIESCRSLDREQGHNVPRGQAVRKRDDKYQEHQDEQQIVCQEDPADGRRTPFETAVAAAFEAAVCEMQNTPARIRQIPVKSGCMPGPDMERIRMWVLRGRVENSDFVVEDAYGDMVGVGDWPGRTDNLVLEKVLPPPPEVYSTKRPRVGSCVHGEAGQEECLICKADKMGLVLKLTLENDPFNVMVTGEKESEFRLLEELDENGDLVRFKKMNRGKLFPPVKKRGKVVDHKWDSPKKYKFVTFYNAGYLSSRMPNFTCVFRQTFILPKVPLIEYSNGLKVQYNQRCAVVELGPIVHRSVA